MIQAYVIIAQSKDIFGPGTLHQDEGTPYGSSPSDRKLIYNPKGFLSIILQKKLNTALDMSFRSS
jgi:hypothetical protein